MYPSQIHLGNYFSNSCRIYTKGNRNDFISENGKIAKENFINYKPNEI